MFTLPPPPQPPPPPKKKKKKKKKKKILDLDSLSICKKIHLHLIKLANNLHQKKIGLGVGEVCVVWPSGAEGGK